MQPALLPKIEEPAFNQFAGRVGTMSYGKRDEDADQAIVKVDRTAVFQEGA